MANVPVGFLDKSFCDAYVLPVYEVYFMKIISLY